MKYLALIALIVIVGAGTWYANAATQEQQPTQVVAGGNPAQGPGAMLGYGCGSCHTIPGVRGANAQVGPPLTGFAGRAYIAGELPNNPENLIRWIRDPQSVEPGTAMPNLGVTESAARDIASYLYTLK